MKSTKTLDLTPGLENIGVLVTRPAHQAEPLCRLIEQHGGSAIRLPVIEIVDVEDTKQLTSQLDELDKYDIAIFISPNAVNKAFGHLSSIKKWPNQINIAAVGKSSAKALDSLGLIADIFPSDRFNSEALLALKSMHEVTGKNIIIFRGEGGRELIAETLRSRGANVVYAECYRRQKPQSDTSELMKRWANGDIDITICTSNEGLLNLYDMVGETGQHLLTNTPIIVVSKRAADLAKELGFKSQILISAQASDEAILNTILDLHKMQA